YEWRYGWAEIIYGGYPAGGNTGRGGGGRLMRRRTTTTTAAATRAWTAMSVILSLGIALASNTRRLSSSRVAARDELHRSAGAAQPGGDAIDVAGVQPGDVRVPGGVNCPAVVEQQTRQRVGRIAGRLLQPGMPLHDQPNRRATEQPCHAGEHVQFGALDVDLHEVRIRVHEIVQRRHPNPLDARDRRIHALAKEAVDGAGLASQEEVADFIGAPGRNGQHDDVVEPVRADVFTQHGDVVGGRLDRHDPPG